MRRFFGMMPGKEVKKEVHYKDKYGFRITIQASTSGWTIIYADYSTDYKDIEDTVDNNFYEALEVATKNLGKLTIDKEYHQLGER